jgi:divalent metal cation (Fe/Co/Zn/Cd) transporter
LLVNLSMAIGKFIGGYVFHSQALVADAYHALTDLVSDFMTLGTVAWSLKPPSKRFPIGYGKVESLGALGVSSLLLCGGVFMGLNAGQVLLAQFFPDAFEALAHAGLLVHGHSHGHDHGVETLGPNINAAWLAGGSIVVKEWLYRASKFPHCPSRLESKELNHIFCYSNEDRKGTQILRPSFECRSPSDRLPHEHCRPGDYRRFSPFHGCVMA